MFAVPKEELGEMMQLLREMMSSSSAELTGKLMDARLVFAAAVRANQGRAPPMGDFARGLSLFTWGAMATHHFRPVFFALVAAV